MAEPRKSGPELKDLRIAIICLAVVGGMVGMAYASVPLYNLFCRVTGFGGTTQVGDIAPQDFIKSRGARLCPLHY